jgi:hypothetical protein
MKDIGNASKTNFPGGAQSRSIRRFIRQLFSSWIKRQNCNCVEEMEKIIGRLQKIEESIEIIAREVAGHAARRK